MKSLFSFLFSIIVHFAFSQECFLVVSSGGGITGGATVYQIRPDGKVLKGKGLGQINYSEQSKLKKSLARKYYRKTRKLIESSPEFHHPGNIYHSIAANENGKEMKMTWGDAEHQAPQKARDLYTEINKTLSELSFTTTTIQ